MVRQVGRKTGDWSQQKETESVSARGPCPLVPLEVFPSLHPSTLLASAPAARVGGDVRVTAQLQGTA